MSKIETDVNSRVRENASVITRQMTPDEAQDAGAVALFGEKYGEEVRVVSMGQDNTSSGADLPYSWNFAAAPMSAALVILGSSRSFQNGCGGRCSPN